MHMGLSTEFLGADVKLLRPYCISDWAPLWADCIWELPVCHQLRRRQPQSQDQRDPCEPLQQLWLPGGDSGRSWRRAACVPPETAAARYSIKSAWISLTANKPTPCLLITQTVVLLLFLSPSLPGLVRSHACALDQFGKAGGCSDICLLGNSHKTRTCRCRSGFSLGSDGKSCKSEYQDGGKSSNFNLKEWTSSFFCNDSKMADESH